MVLFENGNFYFFNVLKNCKRPTISVPERAIYTYYGFGDNIFFDSDLSEVSLCTCFLGDIRLLFLERLGV